jgi:CHRD domain-containing protein
MKGRKGARIALILALLSAVGACAHSQAVGHAVRLCAQLAGAGPSSDATDPEHRGSGVLVLTATAIRYEIESPGLGKVIATHIHHGEAGVNGPMLWELNAGFAGESVRGDAAEIPPGVVALVATYPSEFYLKLHSVAHPGGAIRGQLAPCRK